MATSLNFIVDGTASAGSEYTGRPATNAADGIIDLPWFSNLIKPEDWFYDMGVGKSATPTSFKIYTYKDADGSTTKDVVISGSNDNSSWTQVGSATLTDSASGWQSISCSGSTPYRYFKIHCTNNYRADNVVGFYEVEAYENVTNVFTGGTASADHYTSTYSPDKAVDNDTSTMFAGVTSNNWYYDLGAGVTKAIIKLAFDVFKDAGGTSMKNISVYASSDNATWGSALGSKLMADRNGTQYITFTNTTAYRYWKVYLADSYRGDTLGNIIEVQAYEAPPTGLANLKTWNGIGKASIKTINGIAVASVKTFNGL